MDIKTNNSLVIFDVIPPPLPDDFSYFRMDSEKYNMVKGVDWPPYDEFIKTTINDWPAAIQQDMYKFTLLSKPLAMSKLPFEGIFYHEFFHSILKNKFIGCDKIGEGYSHMWQDIFVLTMLNGKQHGSFLEIGANSPIRLNNTYLLETLYNWRGVSIDIVDYTKSWNIRPNAKFICKNAVEVDYTTLLTDNFSSKQIDYLQIDIDNTDQSMLVLKSLLETGYRFSTLTIEMLENDINSKRIRDLLNEHGYRLLIKDVLGFIPNIDSGPGKWVPLEDWWVDPKMIDDKLIRSYSEVGQTIKTPFLIFTEL